MFYIKVLGQQLLEGCTVEPVGIDFSTQSGNIVDIVEIVYNRSAQQLKSSL